MNICNPDDPEGRKKMRDFFGPQQVDQMVRQAIQFCWFSLPPEKQTVDEVESQVRRIFDRALHDMREDSEYFGLGRG
jgi:hypothetical protein